MNQTRSSKLELAYLQLWLLTPLQRNMFIYCRVPSSAHYFASRGQVNRRCSALFCMFACLACLSSHASSGLPGWGGGWVDESLGDLHSGCAALCGAASSTCNERFAASRWPSPARAGPVLQAGPRCGASVCDGLSVARTDSG
ncbi:hypothetical protein SVAN01_06359 [Stagonosporopsis vannaccii]|nr:hypothetical protein SVAN01_06359 [Stagonosporopsis vannaccii]